MGHGVWEKPVVRELGGGSYRVDNVVIIMGGLWELKVAVKKGESEDRSVFSFTVAEPKAQLELGGGYQRSLPHYQVPDVTLINQGGAKVKLGDLMFLGKIISKDSKI